MGFSALSGGRFSSRCSVSFCSDRWLAAVLRALMTCPSGLNEGDPQSRLLAAPQMRRRLDDRDLQRGPHDALEEVAAARGAVLQAEYRVHVQARCAVVADRDVAEQRQ